MPWVLTMLGSFYIMERRFTIPDYTYYLEQYLKINYPDRVGDVAFITERNALAQRAFVSSMAIHDDYDLANEIAFESLLQGFVFSKYYFIINCLTEINHRFVPDAQFSKEAFSLLKKCAPIFSKYDLEHIIGKTEELERLKCEVKGFVALSLID